MSRFTFIKCFITLKNLLELLTREAEIAKSQQQKKGASEGVNKGGIKIHPDTENEPYHPLGSYFILLVILFVDLDWKKKYFIKEALHYNCILMLLLSLIHI